jgi:hypothetical protein
VTEVLILKNLKMVELVVTFCLLMQYITIMLGSLLDVMAMLVNDFYWASPPTKLAE